MTTKSNVLYTGDNLHFLFRLNSESVDLIYLDPPFNSKRTYSAPVGSKAAGSSFKDMWTWQDIDEQLLETLYTEHPCLADYINTIEGLHGKGMKSYVLYMAVRIKEMHRILKDTGSLYLHCDPTASHYLKLALDKIFGEKNFFNEIVWSYNSRTMTTKWFAKKHDVILFYAKSRNNIFNADSVRIPHKAESEIQYNKVDEQGRRYKPQSDGKRTYLNEKGQPCPDVWNIQLLGSRDKERTGYPTQKPLALINRIILASSNEGDVVLDPFCGCATTCIAAQQLHRRWIGIDIEEKAVDVLIQRLSDDVGMFEDFISTSVLPERTDIEIVKESNDVKKELFEEQDEKCAGCVKKFDIYNLTIDHIIPKSKGGSDSKSNYQLLCHNCNSVKGNRPMEYLMAKIVARERSRKKITYNRKPK